jgi:hypothetical protein
MSTPDGHDPLDRLLGRAVAAARRAEIPEPGTEPSDHALLRYVEGTSDADERAQIEEAARRSRHTRDSIEILKESLAEAHLATPLTQRAARYVIRVAADALDFLRGASAPVAAPALAWAVRGEAACKPEQFLEFDQVIDGDLEARLRIEHVARTAPGVDLQVRLRRRSGAPVPGARVSLLRGGHLVDSAPVEQDGSATFTDLPPDRYQVDVKVGAGHAGGFALDFINDPL